MASRFRNSSLASNNSNDPEHDIQLSPSFPASSHSLSPTFALKESSSANVYSIPPSTPPSLSRPRSPRQLASRNPFRNQAMHEKSDGVFAMSKRFNSETAASQAELVPPRPPNRQENYGLDTFSQKSGLAKDAQAHINKQSQAFRSTVPLAQGFSSISLDVPRPPLQMFSQSGKALSISLDVPKSPSQLSVRSRSNSQLSYLQAIPDSCDSCENSSVLVNFCNICHVRFCDTCWDQQIPHKKKKLGNGGDPHEKTQASVAAKVRNVLEPSVDPIARERLYKDDEATTWFGITRPDGSRPLFQDYGRFGDLMISTNEGRRSDWKPCGHSPLEDADQRTPSLASFVGQTGEGKSALIKLLIDLKNVEYEESGTPAMEYNTPVVGSASGTDPTSEDVHLYIDPCTAYSAEPILFADCEGLDGGEREPFCAKLRKKRRNERSTLSGPLAHQSRTARLISERELEWADATKTKSRQYAVTNLYPRLLYTFSDVIVFVLRNPKVIEGVFAKLVDWADAALETSSNQPLLPYAVIVLNASKSSPEDSWWDVEDGTRNILDDPNLLGTLDRNPTFAKYANKWRSVGHNIETVEQLMRTYYSSVKIIRVPNQGRPKLVQQQVNKLYSCIRSACQVSIDRKREERMLLDADELQSYLQHAFTHFARTLETPFDFVQASFVNSPIPQDFSGNILKLAIDIMEKWENNADANTIFEELSFMVASCIMFDCARKKIVGSPEQIFPKYFEYLDAALENFAQSYWPCEFIKPGGGGRCVNVRSGHSKGHQLKDGHVLAIGEYISEFSFENSRESFRTSVYCCFQNLHGLLQERLQKGQLEIIAASEIHRDVVMAHFYQHATRGKTQLISQTACYCCLFEPPEHVLPCGHILCTSCIRIYGRPRGNTIVEVQDCPIESGNTQNYHSWNFNVYLKPKTAGIRVLTLDGGGIRGIVELEILHLIEKSMGGKLPIRSFFDLIVGTSTGGLVALGLGVLLWSVERCIEFFESLCRTAFTRRTFGTVPFLGWVVDNYYHSKYETKPLEDVLQEAFSENHILFGGPGTDNSSGPAIKVAVTSTSSASLSPVVLSNYNRPCSEKLPYCFQRPERAANEIKTWEAARATSAAPRYFKPFYHKPSGTRYMDGGIWHNNPIAIAERERKLIWSNLADLYPDVVLSIGTATSLLSHGNESPSSSALPLGVIPDIKHKIKIAKNHLASVHDCEKTWNDFLANVDANHLSRFVRLNPQLNMQIPKLDDVDSLRTLRQAVHDRMTQHLKIKQVANRLISSCFYFESTATPSDYPAPSIFSGRIACRLPYESKEIKELGKILRNDMLPERSPHFLIQEEGQSLQTYQKVIIPNDTIEAMILYGQFKLKVVEVKLINRLALTEIKLCLKGDCFPISGFPRVLKHDESLMLNLRRTSTGSKNRWAGRAYSERKQQSHWKPPRMVYTSQVWSLDSFTKSTHVLGLASARDIQRMTDNLTQGSNPPAMPSDNTRFGVFNFGRNKLKGLQRQTQATQQEWPEFGKPELDGNDSYTQSPQYICQRLTARYHGPREQDGLRSGVGLAELSTDSQISEDPLEVAELESDSASYQPSGDVSVASEGLFQLLFRARYDYVGEENCEISMVAGEEFQIHQRHVEQAVISGWCWVTRVNSPSEKGFVPFAYLEECLGACSELAS